MLRNPKVRLGEASPRGLGDKAASLATMRAGAGPYCQSSHPIVQQFERI